MTKELISKEKIEKLQAETERQLSYARQQMIFWTKKTEQLTGSLAICNVILKKEVEKKEDK